MPRQILAFCSTFFSYHLARPSGTNAHHPYDAPYMNDAGIR